MSMIEEHIANYTFFMETVPRMGWDATLSVYRNETRRETRETCVLRGSHTHVYEVTMTDAYAAAEYPDSHYPCVQVIRKLVESVISQ